MKYMKRAIVWILSACIVFGSVSTVEVYATESAVSQSQSNTSKPAISKKTMEVKKGSKKQLSVTGTTEKVRWSSANTDIAKVSITEGTVTGVSCGKVIITAEVEGKQLACLVTVYASKKHTSEWVEKDGRYYYYDEYGQMLTGISTIGGKTYYFDSKGRQRVGWIEDNGTYYYFNTKNKSKGYMVTDATVNDIKVNKKGIANPSGVKAEKLRLLVEANNIVFDFTKSTMKKSEKLKELYMGFAEGDIIVYKNLGHFKKGEKNWEQVYAAYFFDKGYGDCYTAACAFAYLATAIGYDEVYAQSSGGHGWCKINGKYYDPNWAWWGTKDKDKGYAVPKEKSGKEKRPNWAKHETYSKKIS